MSLSFSYVGIYEKIWTGNQIRKFCPLPVEDRSSSGRERRYIASFHSHKLLRSGSMLSSAQRRR